MVISHLPIGTYQLEFLLPNTDYFFEGVPKRKIDITAGSVIRIDQNIHIKASDPSSVEPQQFDQPQEQQPPEPEPEPVPAKKPAKKPVATKK